MKVRAGFFHVAYELRHIETLDKITADHLEEHLA